MRRAGRLATLGLLLAAATPTVARRPVFVRRLAAATDDAAAAADADEGSCRNARNADDDSTRCQLAKSDGCDNKYAAAYYCASDAGSVSLVILYACWLALLFVLLGSTADEYFSPALEQLSEDAGLPPRFAGVTLLALGNGAPDVSSTIHAVSSSPEGYQLALGALTGAGMFVGTCVAGCVMVVADGAKAQGALLRDVTAYLLSAAFVMWLIGVRKVGCLLGGYAAFVLAVLAADLWHRRPGGPYERQAAARARAAEPDAVELMLTLIHDVRRRGPGRGAARVGKTGDEEKKDEEAGSARNPFFDADDDDDDDPDVARPRSTSNPLETPPRAARIVIEGDDFGLGSPLDGGAFEESLLGDDDDENTEGSSDDGIFVADLAARCRGALAGAVGSPWPWKVVAIAELPFVACRACTVPLTARDCYARAPFCLSLLGAPLWLCVYAARRGVDGVFSTELPSPVLVAGLGGLGAASIAAALTKGRASLPFWPALGFALLGFLVAATWIDVFADELVQALEFFGVALGVPEPVLGLTVLAWGNSVGDLSTNVAMAKKGLANMALTACFAGPVFNMLVGLGAGFWIRLAREKASSVDVHLDRGLRIGFVMIAANCALVVAAGVALRGRIPRKFGFLSLSLYVLYMVASLVTLFSADDENDD